MFVSSIREAQVGIKIFREAADLIKGLGTMALIDCSNRWAVDDVYPDRNRYILNYVYFS